MHVQYSFVQPRAAVSLASDPIQFTPSMTVWAGLVAMIATTAAALIAG
jgi:hypothetical protein